jgi:MoxR-like ATPase
MAAKCLALTKGKFSPDIIDVKEVAKNVLRHRLVRNYKAEAEEITSDQIIEQIL